MPMSDGRAALLSQPVSVDVDRVGIEIGEAASAEAWAQVLRVCWYCALLEGASRSKAAESRYRSMAAPSVPGKNFVRALGEHDPAHGVPVAVASLIVRIAAS